MKESGFIEGQNVQVVYRWAQEANDRLPGMADELVNLRIAVLAALGTAAVRAAKAASVKVSPAVPVVFAFGGDPVADGLVASFKRPGGNLTGVSGLGAELGAKRLELLHKLVPTATLIAVLVNPKSSNAEAFVRNVQVRGRTLGLKIEVVPLESAVRRQPHDRP
jgi:putative ABC transport system substrate-binding protein